MSAVRGFETECQVRGNMAHSQVHPRSPSVCHHHRQRPGCFGDKKADQVSENRSPCQGEMPGGPRPARHKHLPDLTLSFGTFGKSDQRVKAWSGEKKHQAGRLLTFRVSEHRYQTQTSRREGHCTKVMGRPESGVGSLGTDPEATVRKSPKSGTVTVGCC